MRIFGPGRLSQSLAVVTLGIWPLCVYYIHTYAFNLLIKTIKQYKHNKNTTNPISRTTRHMSVISLDFSNGIACLAVAGIGSYQRGHMDWRYRECGLRLSATELFVRPVPDSGTACPATSSIGRLLTRSVVGWNISFLVFPFLDISFVFFAFSLFSCEHWRFFT